MRRIVVMSILVPLFCWAQPNIKSVSAVVSGSSNSGRLTISYTISSECGLCSDLACRYVDCQIFSSKDEAKAWGKKIEENYEAASCASELFSWSLYDEDEVSDGTHTYAFDLYDEYGMSARDFRNEYPTAYLLAAVFDNCEETYSYMVVPVKLSISAVSDEVKKFYGKARTLTGVCSSEEEDYYGTVSLKLAKVNTKTGVVKVTATITPFSSTKKVTATANFIPDDDGEIYGFITFKDPIGEAEVTIYPEEYEDDYGREQIDFSFEGYSEVGYAYSADIGGVIDADEMWFRADMDDAPDFGDCWEIVAMPEDVAVYVKNGTKWSFDKAPTLKYKRYSEDGDVWYELDGLDDEDRPNVCGVKLTYTSKTGIFKGTYYLYATNEGCVDGKPTLKKLKVSVSGVIIDGMGYGFATAKLGAESYSWPVYLERVEAHHICSMCVALP